MLDSGTKIPENRIHLFDPVALINDGYGGGYKSSSTIAMKPRRPTKSYGNFEEVQANEGVTSYDSFKNGGEIRSYNQDHDHRSDDGNEGSEIRFEVENNSKDLEDELEVTTPRLWKPLNSSAFHSTSSNLMNNLQTQSTTLNSMKMSPNSRTQAIARGRRELMDMVKDLPESFYELSLKDIVDQKAEVDIQKGIEIPEESSKTEEMTKNEKKKGKKVKKSDSKKKMVRSRSVDNGRFLLKTSVFPMFSGSKKKKKSMNGSDSFKIASMSKQQQGLSVSVKGGEKDWWRRKSCISSESDDSNGLSSKSGSSGSSSSSSLSSSSNGRRRSNFFRNCCLFSGKKITKKKKNSSLIKIEVKET